ncbi:hypothetical protein ACJ7VZ_05910 [Aeromonas salmonicida]|uniref:hypothetical protein n=1 Tax=Aeromonas salmonicida TaxID=645 RepID=UPI00259EA02F|nr:hypothetical protein [Aeromonas salmonicida]MDM5128641.1 hypothetical protein [Aeromonas salmonicida]HDN9016074.1 hypothetical protein [Aeromonas salmonicida]
MDVFTVLLVILLFPGVLFVIIIDNFTEHKKWDSWKYILYSIVSGIFAYFILQVFILSLQFFYDIKGVAQTNFYYLDVWNVINGSSKKFEPIEVISSGAVAILSALFFLKIKTTSAIHNVLIALNVSEKYGDEPVFSKVVRSTSNEYVIVMIMDENISLTGMVHYYHMSEEGMQELGMIDVEARDMRNAETIFTASKLYISKPQGQLIIYTVPPVTGDVDQSTTESAESE